MTFRRPTARQYARRTNRRIGSTSLLLLLSLIVFLLLPSPADSSASLKNYDRTGRTDDGGEFQGSTHTTGGAQGRTHTTGTTGGAQWSTHTTGGAQRRGGAAGSSRFRSGPKKSIEITFVNRHNAPVELYWINDRRVNHLTTLQPGEKSSVPTMLSYEFYARDERVDRWDGSPGRDKFSTNSTIGRWKITSDPVSSTDGNTIYIESSCFDMSAHCEGWEASDECRKNPRFMRETCPKTCGHCPQVNESTGATSSNNSSGGDGGNNGGEGSTNGDEL